MGHRAQEKKKPPNHGDKQSGQLQHGRLCIPVSIVKLMRDPYVGYGIAVSKRALHYGPWQQTAAAPAHGTEGLFITDILPDGTAYKDGQLRQGDCILSVNGHATKDLSQESVVMLMRCSSEIRLVVCRNHDNEHATVPPTNASSSRTPSTGSSLPAITHGRHARQSSADGQRAPTAHGKHRSDDVSSGSRRHRRDYETAESADISMQLVSCVDLDTEVILRETSSEGSTGEHRQRDADEIFHEALDYLNYVSDVLDSLDPSMQGSCSDTYTSSSMKNERAQYDIRRQQSFPPLPTEDGEFTSFGVTASRLTNARSSPTVVYPYSPLASDHADMLTGKYSAVHGQTFRKRFYATDSQMEGDDDRRSAGSAIPTTNFNCITPDDGRLACCRDPTTNSLRLLTTTPTTSHASRRPRMGSPAPAPPRRVGSLAAPPCAPSVVAQSRYDGDSTDVLDARQDAGASAQRRQPDLLTARVDRRAVKSTVSFSEPVRDCLVTSSAIPIQRHPYRPQSPCSATKHSSGDDRESSDDGERRVGKRQVVVSDAMATEGSSTSFECHLLPTTEDDYSAACMTSSAELISVSSCQELLGNVTTDPPSLDDTTAVHSDMGQHTPRLSPDLEPPMLIDRGQQTSEDFTTHAHRRAYEDYQNGETYRVELKRLRGGIGMSVARMNTPKNNGVYVRAVKRGGAADLDGRVRVGDKLIEVDGVNVAGADHRAVVRTLNGAGHTVRMLLHRHTNGNPLGRAKRKRFEVVLSKATVGFGFSIQRKENEDGIEIRQVFPGTPADRCMQLQPGDELLAVNRQRLRGFSHADVINLLRSSDVIRLTLLRRSPSDEDSTTSHDTKHDSRRQPASDGESLVCDTSVRYDNTHESPVQYNNTDESPVRYNNTHESPVQYNNTDESPVRYNNTHESPVRYNNTHESPVRYNNTHESPVSYNNTHESPVSYNNTHESPVSYNNTHESPVQYNNTHESPVRYDNTHESPGRHNTSRESPIRYNSSHERSIRGDPMSISGGSTRSPSPNWIHAGGRSQSSDNDMIQANSTAVHMSATCAEDDRKHRQTIPRQHSTDCEEMSAAHLDYEVSLLKEDNSLGFTVTIGEGENVCVIRNVYDNPAASDGRLRRGDVISEVNGIKTTGLAYNEVVRILRWAPTVVTLRLRRHADTVGSLTSLDILKGRLSCEDCEASLDDSDMDSNTRSRKKRIMTEKLRAFSRRPLKVSTRKLPARTKSEKPGCGSTDGLQRWSTDLGLSTQSRETADSDSELRSAVLKKQFVLISLAKPVDGSFGFVVSGSKKGVFVKQIAADGPAAQEGRLKVGDQLVQINERSVIGQAPNKVIMTLRAVHGEVDFVFARKRRFSISELPRPSASRSASPIHLNRRSASPSPIHLNRRSASASPLHLNRRSASASPTAAATATPRSSRRSSSVVRTDSWPRESQAELTAPASRARHTSAGGVRNSASNTSINIRRQPSATTAASTDRVALDARELLTKESSIADLHNTAGYLDCQPSGKHENSAYVEDTAGRLENQTSVKCRETADLHSRANYPDQQSAGGYKLNTVSYLDQQTPGKYKPKTVSYRDQQPAGGYKLNTVGYLDQHPSGEYNLNALHYFENKPRSKYCQLSNPENNADYHIDRQPSGKYWQLTEPHNTVGHQDSQASGKRANIPAPPSSPRAHGQRLSSTVLYCQAFPSNNWRRQQLLKQTRHSDGNLLETYRGEREEEPRGQRDLEADDSNDCERAPTTLRSQSYRDVSTHGRQPVEGKAVLDELKAALENRREESPDVCSTAMPLLDVRTPCTLSKADSWPRHMQTAGDSIDRRQMSSAVSSHRYLPTLGGVHHAADDVNLDDVFNDYDDVTDGCRDMYLISNYSDKYNRNVKI